MCGFGLLSKIFRGFSAIGETPLIAGLRAFFEFGVGTYRQKYRLSYPVLG